MHTNEGAPSVVEGSESTKAKKKIVIVEHAGAIETESRDAAEAHMSASKKELKGVRGVFKKIWKHNLFHEYYRQKEIALVREKILNTKSLFAGEKEARVAHKAAMGALTDRFLQEYEEAVHKEAGESREVLGNEETDVDTREEIHKVLRDYAAGNLTEETFEEERNRILSKLTGLSREAIQSEVRHTDSLREVAHGLRQSVEHGSCLEDLDIDFDIVIGRAKCGVRTEAQFNTVDRIVEKIQSSRVGKFLNETTVASAVAIAYSLTAGLSQRLARSKALAWGSFGLTAAISGGVAAARESKRIEEERRQHGREMAKGQTFEETQTPRRKEMENYRYETKDAYVITRELSDTLEYDLKEAEAFSRVVEKLSDIEARVRLSDRHSIDLISYSSGDLVENERLNLDIARAKAKVKLRQMYASGQINLTEGETMDGFLAKSADLQMEILTKGDAGIEEKNRIFRKMKTKRVVGAALKGLGTGLVIGGVFQEAVAFFSDAQSGVVEGMVGIPHEAGERITALERLRMFLKGETFDTPLVNSIETHAPDGSLLKLPEDIEIVPNAGNANVFDLVRDGETIASGLECKDGVLTAASANVVEDAGGFVAVDSHQEMVLVPGERTAVDVAGSRTDLFHRIHRTLWYGNDTPKPIFDKNELKLDWGGGGDGFDDNGNFTFNIARMRADGSFQDGFSVDAQKAMKEGKLKMILSLTRDTQREVVEIPIDAHGNAAVDPNSEIGKMFFSQKDGKAVFHGAFAEVVQSTGVGEDGGENVRILATHIGDESAVREVIPEPVLVPESKVVSITNITLPPGDDLFVVPPMVIPVFGRKPLESTKQPTVPPLRYTKPPEIGIGYYYNSFPEQSEQQCKARMSESLRNNPDAQLDTVKEVRQYIEKQDEKYREQIKLLAGQADPMENGCKVAVCIPAAGHQEGGNIYRTLENYTHQIASRDSFEILILVNRPDVDEEGKRVEPDQTINEIQRFKKAYPDMPVRVMEVILPKGQAKIGTIRKLLTDSALVRYLARGSAVSSDLILLSNDADNKGMAPEYVDNFIKKFDSNTDTDAFLGQLDWDPESYIRNPLVHVGTRFFQYVHAVLQRRWKSVFGSSGASFAYRASVYAAVDGYTDGMTGGEDCDVGGRIRLARRGAKTHVAVRYAGNRVSRLYTSSRRAERAIKDGLSPSEQWTRKFSAFDDDVRKVKWELTGGMDWDDISKVETFVNQLETVLNRTITQTMNDSIDRVAVTKALGWLGISFEFNKDRGIRIVNADKLINGLKKYQVEGLDMMKRKTGELSKKRKRAKTER
jgi:hypothetical protein